MSQKPQRRTQWGWVVPMMALALLLIYAIIHNAWYAHQAIELHLRDIFKESGFRVPDDVSEIRGQIGWKDFHGDFPACLTFTVRPDQIDSFMHLPERGKWKHPGDFKAWDDAEFWRGGDEESNISEIQSPAGTFIIQEWDGDYRRRYGVNRMTRQIFFERSST